MDPRSARETESDSDRRETELYWGLVKLDTD